MQTAQLSHDFLQAACSTSKTTTLEMLNETSDMVFKAYLTSKTQGWFWLRRLNNPVATLAAPLTPGGAGGAGAATQARPPKMQVSDGDEDGGGLGGGSTGGGLSPTDWDTPCSTGTSPVQMCQTQRTSQALSRRTTYHRH